MRNTKKLNAVDGDTLATKAVLEYAKCHYLTRKIEIVIKFINNHALYLCAQKAKIGLM